MKLLAAAVSFPLFLLAFAWLLFGCPPPGPPAPVPPDATDAAPVPLGDASTPCQAACDRLSALGCSRGNLATCVPALAHVDGAKLIRKGDGGALTCADIAAAQGASDLGAIGIHCAGP